jgi:FkbM family methyltransferase
MKKFQLISYNYDEQKIEYRLNIPIKDGYLIARDIDLETTVYKFPLKDVHPGFQGWFIPTPRHGFDFQREDFGGFIFELIDEEVILEKEFLRFRDTDMYKYKQHINDFYHPVFVNYREFFVYDRYKPFSLDGCKNVIDVGASVGLFTRYMLNKGAERVTSVECDERSITALVSNFSQNPRVNIVPKALSGEEGEKTLYWREDNPLVNSLDFEGSEFSKIADFSSKTVQSTTLENLIKDLNWDKIDLLKIDIEGSEWDVIDSTSNNTFESISKILLEYHWPNGRLQQVIERFTSLGFKHIFEEGYNGSEENGTVFFY